MRSIIQADFLLLVVPDRHLRTAGVWRMNVCKKDQRIDRRPGFDTHRVLLRARVDWSRACL